jgi:hypothetical protein
MTHRIMKASPGWGLGNESGWNKSPDWKSTRDASSAYSPPSLAQAGLCGPWREIEGAAGRWSPCSLPRGVLDNLGAVEDQAGLVRVVPQDFCQQVATPTPDVNNALRHGKSEQASQRHAPLRLLESS